MLCGINNTIGWIGKIWLRSSIQWRELRSRLAALLAHLLKRRYQAERRSRSWEGTILEQRFEREELLAESQSLSNYLPETIEKAYRQARTMAAREMGLKQAEWESLLPAECPWRFEQLLDQDFWP
ncbi:MAG: DUF29 domain-containing protein [Candidatus Binataceae bacterium]